MESSKKLRFQTEGRTIEIDMVVSEDGIVRDEIHMLEKMHDDEWHISKPK